MAKLYNYIITVALIICLMGCALLLAAKSLMLTEYVSALFVGGAVMVVLGLALFYGAIHLASRRIK